jgi:long-chain acyl-CoA synthetase
MVIIFTSGTTGRAKGVVLTQKNYTPVVNHAVPRMNLGPDDTVLSVLPLHHVFGFAASVAAPLCAGMDIVFVPYVKAQLILEALRDKEVTMLPAVPKMISLFYESVMHNVKKQGPVITAIFTGLLRISAVLGPALGTDFRRTLFSSVHKGFGGRLRLMISGGAALNKKYWNRFTLMGFTILEGYGLSETFGPIAVCPGDKPKIESVGPLLPENEIQIHDPNTDGYGEILLRGLCVFAGYYHNDTLTHESFDTNGWFHTGDIGRIDDEGFLFISGRKKDVIVLDTGKNVYPDELEDYYEQSPLIEEIGVIGAKKDDCEIVAAAIVPSKELRKSKSIEQTTAVLYQELIRLGKSQPVHRRITDFITVFQPLPRTTTRKLKKPEILKLYNSIKRTVGALPSMEAQLSVIEIALMETDEYKGVLDGIAKIAPDVDFRALTPRSHLEIDLGLDSLGSIELMTAIERTFSIAIPEEVFDKLETIADLVYLVKEQKTGKSPTSVEKVMGLRERILDMSYYRLPLPQGPSGMKAPKTAILQTLFSIVKGIKKAPSYAMASHNPPFIFVMQHKDPVDAVVLLQALPKPVARETFSLAEPIDYPWFPWNFYRHHLITVRKPNDPIEILKTSLAILKQGKNLISFPEGLVGSSHKTGEFKSGVGLAARETNASIVPVKRSGSNVFFGKPFTLQEVITEGGVKHDASTQEIADYIKRKLLTL